MLPSLRHRIILWAYPSYLVVVSRFNSSSRNNYTPAADLLMSFSKRVCNNSSQPKQYKSLWNSTTSSNNNSNKGINCRWILFLPRCLLNSRAVWLCRPTFKLWIWSHQVWEWSQREWQRAKCTSSTKREDSQRWWLSISAAMLSNNIDQPVLLTSRQLVLTREMRLIVWYNRRHIKMTNKFIYSFKVAKIVATVSTRYSLLLFSNSRAMTWGFNKVTVSR